MDLEAEQYVFCLFGGVPVREITYIRTLKARIKTGG
jgi:hypothetical protein